MTAEEKEISANAMFQVAMEAEHEVTALKKELKQRDETIKELKGALKVCIKDLMYISTTGHLWMWGRNGGTEVPERLLNARKLIEDELNEPEK